MIRVFAATLVLIVAPLAAQAECPFSAEDFNDDSRVVAHIECKTEEMFDAAKRAEAARKNMASRLTQFYGLLDAEGDEKLHKNQSAWGETTNTCPPLSNNLDEMIAHQNCLERAYIDRAQFLDARLSECESVGCKPDTL